MFFIDGKLLHSRARLFKAFIAFLVAFQTLFFAILIRKIPTNRIKTDTIRSDTVMPRILSTGFIKRQQLGPRKTVFGEKRQAFCKCPLVKIKAKH